MKSTKAVKPSFEEALKRLEEIVSRMESPEIPLQEGFNLYQEGMTLASGMKKELDTIEKKVKILHQSGDAKMEETDFDMEEDHGDS